MLPMKFKIKLIVNNLKYNTMVLFIGIPFKQVDHTMALFGNINVFFLSHLIYNFKIFEL